MFVSLIDSARGCNITGLVWGALETLSRVAADTCVCVSTAVSFNPYPTHIHHTFLYPLRLVLYVLQNVLLSQGGS